MRLYHIGDRSIRDGAGATGVGFRKEASLLAREKVTEKGHGARMVMGEDRVSKFLTDVIESMDHPDDSIQSRKLEIKGQGPRRGQLTRGEGRG